MQLQHLVVQAQVFGRQVVGGDKDILARQQHLLGDGVEPGFCSAPLRSVIACFLPWEMKCNTCFIGVDLPKRNCSPEASVYKVKDMCPVYKTVLDTCLLIHFCSFGYNLSAIHSNLMKVCIDDWRFRYSYKPFVNSLNNLFCNSI